MLILKILLERKSVCVKKVRHQAFSRGGQGREGEGSRENWRKKEKGRGERLLREREGFLLYLSKRVLLASNVLQKAPFRAASLRRDL